MGEFRIVLDHCPISMLVAEVYLDSRQFFCEDDDFSCTIDDEGALVYRFQVPPNRSVMSLLLAIMSTEQNALFDYDVHYRIYR